jgi:hypothetical protein
LPTDSQLSTHHNREQLSKAREAAEALFRPKQPSVPASAPPSGPIASSPTIEQPARAPRVFAVPRPKRLDEDPPAQIPKPQRAKAKQQSAKLPASEHARVRTLTDYGMTAEQVAELYEVSVETIQHALVAPGM